MNLSRGRFVGGDIAGRRVEIISAIDKTERRRVLIIIDELQNLSEKKRERVQSERQLAPLISSEIVETHVSPAFPVIFSAFMCSRLPQDLTWTRFITKRTEFKAKGPYYFSIMEQIETGPFNDPIISLKDMITMREHFESNVNFTSADMRGFAFMMIDALFALWDTLRIQHRSLKPSNILLKLAAPQEVNNWIYMRRGTPFHVRYAVDGSIDGMQLLLRPMISGYNLSKRLSKKDKQSSDVVTEKIAKSTGGKSLSYRAPELIFVNSDKDKILFTHESDVFSMGVNIARLALNTHPFLQYVENRPDEVKAFSEKLRKKLKPVCLETRGPKKLKPFLCQQGRVMSMPNYITGMVMALGIPTEENWPGISKSPFWLLFKDGIDFFENEIPLLPSEKKQGLLFKDLKSRSLMNDDGILLLKSMLQWNPSKRPSAEQLILEAPYFKPFKIAGRKLSRQAVRPLVEWTIKGKKKLVPPKRVQPSRAAKRRRIRNAMIVSSIQQLKPTFVDPKRVNTSLKCFSEHDSNKIRMCHLCQRVNENLSQCKCGEAFYCNAECQGNDWEQHREYCSTRAIKLV